MKNFKKHTLKGGVLLGTLACTQLLQASSLTPNVTFHHQQVSANQVNVELGVENLSDTVIALEVSIVADDIKSVLDMTTKIENGYMTYQLLNMADGQEKLICYIVASDKEKPFKVNQGKLSLGQFSLQTSGKLTLDQDAISIKTIETGYQTNQYKDVEVHYTEESYVPDDVEDDNNTGGDSDIDQDQNGSTGDNNGNTESDAPTNGSTGGNTGNNNNIGNNNSVSNGNTNNSDATNNESSVPENNTQVVNFTDLEGHWAKSAIENMASRGIIKGYADGSFKPSASITRGEFATLLARAFEMKQTDSQQPFKDVASDKWYTEGITALYQMGITSGRPDGTFGVNELITNEEISTMLYRAINVLKLELTTENTLSTEFTDHTQISHYAKEAVEALRQMGIISGNPDGSFKPKSSTSRAQVAVMLERIFNRIEQ